MCMMLVMLPFFMPVSYTHLSIFLGGKEPTTLKELAAVLGKETIDTYNTGESRGRETSHSLNYQKLGKELMSQDELAVMAVSYTHLPALQNL